MTAEVSVTDTVMYTVSLIRAGAKFYRKFASPADFVELLGRCLRARSKYVPQCPYFRLTEVYLSRKKAR
jgi:hypothetical protein